jgi:hypothetical protein
VTYDGSVHPISDDGEVVVDADVGAIEVGRADVTLDAEVFVTGTVNIALYAIAGPELWARVSPVTSHLQAGIDGWNVELGAAVTGGLRFTLPLLPIDPLAVDFGRWQTTYYTGSGTW